MKRHPLLDQLMETAWKKTHVDHDATKLKEALKKRAPEAPIPEDIYKELDHTPHLEQFRDTFGNSALQQRYKLSYYKSGLNASSYYTKPSLKAEEHRKKADAIIRSSQVKSPFPIYRSSVMPVQPAVGSSFHTKKITSSSMSRAHAFEGMNRTRPHLFQINLKPGDLAFCYKDPYGDDHRIHLPSETRFRVTKHEILKHPQHGNVAVTHVEVDNSDAASSKVKPKATLKTKPVAGKLTKAKKVLAFEEHEIKFDKSTALKKGKAIPANKNGGYSPGLKEHEALQKTHKKTFAPHYKTFGEEHKKVIERYKSNSGYLNKPLRSGKKVHSSEADHVPLMDHVTSGKLAAPITTYRGYAGSDVHNDFPIGHEFTDHGYAGTSLRPAVTHEFANPKKHHFQIDLKKGQRGHYLDLTRSGSTAREDEVLLPRGTRFRVEKHGYDEMGNKRTHLSVVSQTPS